MALLVVGFNELGKKPLLIVLDNPFLIVLDNLVSSTFERNFLVGQRFIGWSRVSLAGTKYHCKSNTSGWS